MFEKSNRDTHLASKGLNLTSHEYFIVHDKGGNGQSQALKSGQSPSPSQEPGGGGGGGGGGGLGPPPICIWNSVKQNHHSG